MYGVCLHVYLSLCLSVSLNLVNLSVAWDRFFTWDLGRMECCNFEM